MTRKKKNAKLLRRREALVRYSAKRRTLKWKKRKIAQKLSHRISTRRERLKKEPPLRMSSPKEFCLVSNTDEVLAYFSSLEKKLRAGKGIEIDISDIEKLTPETVALLVANIADPDFHHRTFISGNAPKDLVLKKIFTESGFYQHVNGNNNFSQGEENFLHREVHKKVEPTVATRAALIGTKHVFGKTNSREASPIVDSLHEMLVEFMSNTNDHADNDSSGKCLWWLYVYSDPNKNISTFTFIDLGVGIFKSVSVQNYLKKLFKGTPLYKNINLVDDLLAGRIKSRVGKDKDIRGKGIPQIVENSALKNFENFHLIANDVKINLRTGEREELKHSLHGTLWHWELHN